MAKVEVVKSITIEKGKLKYYFQKVRRPDGSYIYLATRSDSKRRFPVIEASVREIQRHYPSIAKEIGEKL